MDGQFNDNVQLAEWIKWVFGSGAMGALASGLVLLARRMWRNDQIAAVDTTESTRSTKALGDLTASLFDENRKLRAELDHKTEMLIALYRDLHGLDHPPAPDATTGVGGGLEEGHGQL